MFVKSASTLYWCILALLPCVNVLSQAISGNPPNTGGWVSPDKFFSFSQNLEFKRESFAVGNAHDNARKVSHDFKGATLDKDQSSIESCSLKGEGDAARAFLQRFIHMLLDVSHLNDAKMESVNHAEIRFSLTDEQLVTLQTFAKDGVKAVSLRKLDEIFAAMFSKSYNYMPKVWFYSERLLNMLPNIQIWSLFIGVLVPAVFFICVLCATGSVSKSFLWLLPVAFVSTYTITVLRLSEESELQHYEVLKMYPDIPKDCSENEASWFWFFNNKDYCSKAFKAHNLNPKLRLTPLKVLSEMGGEIMSVFMVQFGTGLSHFAKVFSELSWWKQIVIVPAAFVLLYSVIALLLLFLSGGSLGLPLFMGSLNFHNSHKHDKTVSGDVPPTTTRSELEPLASNITLNFHQAFPANISGIMSSISQNQMAPLKSALTALSNEIVFQPQQPLFSFDTPDQNLQLPLVQGTFKDTFGGGDASSTNERVDYGHRLGSTNNTLSKQNVNVGQERLPKQLSHLSAKYRACESKRRVRHLSL